LYSLIKFSYGKDKTRQGIRLISLFVYIGVLFLINWFAFGVWVPHSGDKGKAFLANYIGPQYTARLSSLQARHAVFYGKASSCENPVLIRLNDRDDFLKTFRPENPPAKLPKFDAKSLNTNKNANEPGQDEIDDLPF